MEVLDAGMEVLQDCWEQGFDGGAAMLSNEGRGAVTITMGQVSPEGEGGMGSWG